ncbi:DoxX family protein [Cytobacillus oceanisediminis]|uniref:DoxX family protein n=1 Tax=Cytobacillus oceanisediminis TaxID=665099 RepID=UPI003734FF35
MMDVGLLIIRLVIGVLFIGHGAQKLFGWFGGHGLKGTGGWFESIGMKQGVMMVLSAGLAELIGGILFALGFLTPLAALMISGTEYNLTLISVAIGIALIGPGRYALDFFLF